MALPAAHHDLDGLRHPEPHGPRDPRVEDGCRADPERHAPHRAGVRGVRVAPDDDHAGLGMPLEDLRMADRLRAVSHESQLAVQADALFLGAMALLILQLLRTL